MGIAVAMDQFQRTIDGLAEPLALMEPDGTIIATNEAWRRNVEDMELEGLDVGGNYRSFCAGRDNPDSLAIFAGFDEVASGQSERFRHAYAATELTRGRDYEMHISSLELAGRRLLIVAARDVTAERILRQQCRRLEADILQVQALERQRIGRDLHDSTAQELVALRLSLIRLKQLRPDPSITAVLSEIEATLDQMNLEIRAISYLLHPPSLEGGNLVQAIEQMATGFARRINLDISFRFEGEAAPWDRVVQAALYRLAQEALANVQRHAHAGQARIHLVARPNGYLHLIIEDNGIGSSLGLNPTLRPQGVGIASMKERIVELGGRMSIRHLEQGTRIVASLLAGLDEGGPRDDVWPEGRHFAGPHRNGKVLAEDGAAARRHRDLDTLRELARSFSLFDLEREVQPVK